MLRRFKEFAAMQKSDGFIEFEWSDRVVKRGAQVFAVFGHIAYDVTKMRFETPAGDDPGHRGCGRICVPIDGRYFAGFPDEGTCGVMGCYIVNRKGVNQFVGPAFVTCGWLHTKELELTNQQIAENIVEDIEAGKNVYFSKPAGWA